MPLAPLPTLLASRYLQPLREGGSLPAVVDTDGGGRFVAKFRGAGQGARALIAELVVALLAKTLGLPVPELVLLEVRPELGRTEPDPEIQDILRKSQGLNVGLAYLDGAFNFHPVAAGEFVTPELASQIVWLDALVTNPDRTHKNPNLMLWGRKLWLIDHGAALYAQHAWGGVDEERTRTPFSRISDHVLLREAESIRAVDTAFAPLLDVAALAGVLAQVPDAFFEDPAGPVGTGEFPTADAARARYVTYLATRLRAPRFFADEAIAARARLLSRPATRLGRRR